jgi:hypothetical protein
MTFQKELLVSEIISVPAHISRGQKKQGSSLVVESARKPMMTAAYASLYLFYFVYFFRPADFIPGLAAVPLAKIAGALTCIALLGAILSGRVRLNTEVKLIIAFAFPVHYGLVAALTS